MSQKKYSAMIGQMTVSSDYEVIVYGSVRGIISQHRLASAATRSLSRDQAGCRSQGGYSDAAVYRITAGGWREAHTPSYAE